jgi:uncharacterized membrane protein YkvI
MSRLFRVYLLPGAVLQSVLIGGGYGTGREVVEFFTRFGMGGGILAIAVSAVSIAIVFGLSLELSRKFSVYDYRHFFQLLLGRFWIAYELLAILLFVLVIAVIGAAAGEIVNNELGIGSWVGSISMLICVMVLIFYGRDLVTKVLAFWSLFLYVVFAVYLLVVYASYHEQISAAFAVSDIVDGWFVSGLQYSFYNVTAIPMILFAATAIQTRREALGAGVAGACIAVFPALMLHASFASSYPSIIATDLPIYEIFDSLNLPWLKIVYLIVLVGTFIETGAGVLQGFVERLDGWWMDTRGRPLSSIAHALFAGAGVILAGALSSVGVVALIGQGYGTLAWGFLVLYVLPLITVGVWKTWFQAK